MYDASLFWGTVEEIKENQVNVRSRDLLTGFIDVLAQESEIKQSTTLIKKDDPILVLRVGHLTIGILGAPAKKLELEEGIFETISYSDGTVIKKSEKKLEIEGFDEVSSKAKAFKILANEVILGEGATEAPGTEMVNGVVTRLCTCAFTGLPHPVANPKIKVGL